MIRVVVTGMGVLTACGEDVPSFWENLTRGRCGIDRFADDEYSGLRFRHGARLKSFDPAAHFESKELEALDPFTQYFAVACRQAAQNVDLTAAAVIVGSAGGGQVTLDQEYHRLYATETGRVRPFTIARFMPSAAASRVSLEHQIKGPAFSVSSACSSATQAIGQAFHLIRLGNVSRALAGGSEAPFCQGFLKAWESMRVVDKEPCRPFSADRQGMSLGEGAGVLLLESLPSALGRQAPILGEVLGFGITTDAGDLTRPSAEGAAKAMTSALADAQLDYSQVDYINAHGTGTRLNDSTETGAIRQVFGRQADNLLVSSTKSMHGHALGASGGLEAVATLLALKHGIVPPTVNLTLADPECDLDCVANVARTRDLRFALSNSFAFGGLNTTLVLARYSDLN